MIARILVTAAAIFLGVVACWSDALGAGHWLNPVGLLLFFLAAVVWFGWETVRSAFLTAKRESDLPIIRLGPVIIKGMGSSRQKLHTQRSSR